MQFNMRSLYLRKGTSIVKHFLNFSNAFVVNGVLSTWDSVTVKYIPYSLYYLSIVLSTNQISIIWALNLLSTDYSMSMP